MDEVTKPEIDPATNRFTTGQGYVYDQNGNIVQDAEGRTFVFNGDDRQTEVKDTATGQTVGKYFYDGSGARVKKYVPGTGETTVFVYDAGGALAAEYSTVSAPSDPTTSYLTTDHLGSPRVVTDSDGEVISRRDFMPFGEELGAGVGARTVVNKYAASGTDNIRKRFTGYEKDDETGLDFAEARMYQNRHGRFTTVDPLLGSSSAVNPQTFNRYTYTGNNPINYTDPSGLTWCRDSNFTTQWQGGVGSECSEGFKNVDNLVGTLTDGDMSAYSTNGPARAGSIIYLNPNGTVQVQQPSPEIEALASGNTELGTVNVQTEQVEVITTSASTVSTEIAMRPVCAPAYQCSGLQMNISPMTPEQAENAADKLHIALGTCGLLFDPCDLADGAVSLVEGDWENAALTVPILIPYLGIAPGIARLGRRVEKLSEAGSDAKKLRNSTLKPGPHAGESIPARGPGRDFTRAERDAINKIGQDTGCHTCGTKNPGTKSGDFVPDHQLPNKLNPTGKPQRLYPQCLRCSKRQGGQVRGRRRP